MGIYAQMKRLLLSAMEPAEPLEFVLDEPLSSSAFIAPRVPSIEPAGIVLEAKATLDEMPPAFRTLAVPQLPELPREDRAHLMMQSPTRLFFYWSFGAKPYRRLEKALGARITNYSIAIRLVSIDDDVEEIFAADASGSAWFSASPEKRYRAEVGFYAPNAPFVRVLFSNAVETPRRSPSERVAPTHDWSVSDPQFARVLEAAGFEEDAVEIAAANLNSAEAASTALQEFFGPLAVGVNAPSQEVWRLLQLVAAGHSLEGLRYEVDASLFRLADRLAGSLNPIVAADILERRLGAAVTDWEETGSRVFGESRIRFPRRRRIPGSPSLKPISS